MPSLWISVAIIVHTNIRKEYTCISLYVYNIIYERKRDKHTLTTFKTSPPAEDICHHLTQGVVRSIISEDDLLQPILSELTHVAEGGHLSDTKTFCKKKLALRESNRMQTFHSGIIIVHPYSSSWHTHTHIYMIIYAHWFIEKVKIAYSPMVFPLKTWFADGGSSISTFIWKGSLSGPMGWLPEKSTGNRKASKGQVRMVYMELISFLKGWKTAIYWVYQYIGRMSLHSSKIM